MDLIVTGEKAALWGGRLLRCAVGKGGFTDAAEKREGDMKTPVGRWPMRAVYYRPDRVATPETALPVKPICPDDGWCDAPDDAHYNCAVKHPYPASAERMWRDDHLYDVVVVLGYNDAPVRRGAGSAIFMHLAEEDYGPSAGCVKLSLQDLLAVLREATPQSAVEIRPVSAP